VETYHVRINLSEPIHGLSQPASISELQAHSLKPLRRKSCSTFAQWRATARGLVPAILLTIGLLVAGLPTAAAIDPPELTGSERSSQSSQAESWKGLLFRSSAVDDSTSDYLDSADPSAPVSNRYFSPNGDGIKDTTVFSFSLAEPGIVTVEVTDHEGEVVRSEPGIEAGPEGAFEWDGRSNAGAIVADGEYRLAAIDWSGNLVRTALTTVDTNHSPLFESLNTTFARITDLTCDERSLVQPQMPLAEDWVYFRRRRVRNDDTFSEGIFRAGTSGEGIEHLFDVPSPFNLVVSDDNEWLAYTQNAGNWSSPSNWYRRTDGSSAATFTNFSGLHRGYDMRPGTQELLYYRPDGLWSRPLDGSRPEWLISSEAMLPVSPDGSHTLGQAGDLYRIVEIDTSTNVDLVEELPDQWLERIRWSPDSSRVAIAETTWEGPPFGVGGRLQVFDLDGDLVQSFDLPLDPIDSVPEYAYIDPPSSEGATIELDHISELSWSASGDELVFMIMYQELGANYFYLGDYGGIFRAHLVTGELETIAWLEPWVIHTYYIATWDGAAWVDRAARHFGVRYTNREFDLSDFLPDADGELKVRIRQSGSEAAHVDSAALVAGPNGFEFEHGPVTAVRIDTGEDVLAGIAEADLDVVELGDSEIEIRWKNLEVECEAPSNIRLALYAREENLSNRATRPFTYPEEHDQAYSYDVRNRGSLLVDGLQTATDNLGEPLFAVRTWPDTGHPAGVVYGYVTSDAEHLYAALDFTVDNTEDGDADWAALQVNSGSGWQELRVNISDSSHGAVTFTHTGRVHHAHKYYEFKVPLAKIGAVHGQTLELRFAAYGTAALLDDESFFLPQWGRDPLWLPGERKIFYTGVLGPAYTIDLENDNQVAQVLLDHPRVAEHRLMPNQRGLLFQSDTAILNPLSPCYNPDANLQTAGWFLFDSLTNLVAELRALPSDDGQSVSLEGTAADLRFARYFLEYADQDQPDLWYPIGVPSQQPVVNSIFTTWIPPGDASYLVRLTVEDLAGNQRHALEHIPGGWEPTAINDIYLTPHVFSPNGDSELDTATLHYQVLQAVDLEIVVHDSEGTIVRTFNRSHSTIGSAEDLVWDGRDDNGLPLPDGEYRLTLLGFEFFVTIDTEPPTIDLSLFDAFTGEVDLAAADRNLAVAPYLTLCVSDPRPHLGTLQSGLGELPSEWSDLGEVSMRRSCETFRERYPLDASELVNHRFRIEARDVAANTRVVSTPLGGEELILYGLTPVGSPLQVPADGGPLTLEQGELVISVVETIRQPLLQVAVQLRPLTEQTWLDVPLSDGFINELDMELLWDMAEIETGIVTDIRVRATDIDGTVFVSNPVALVSTGPPPCEGTELIDPVITTDTTWSLDGSPFLVSGALTINPGVSLTIAAGVEIMMATEATIVVNGTLDLQGSESQPVVFTSFNDQSTCAWPGSSGSPAAADWTGIQVVGGGTMTAAWSLLRHANIAIDIVDTALVQVSDSRIESTNTGIRVDGASQPVVLNRVVFASTEEGSIGLVTDGSAAPVVEGCTFEGPQVAVKVLGGANPDLGGGAGGSAGGNTIIGSSLSIDHQGTANLAAIGNWWGCRSTAEMMSGWLNISAINNLNDGLAGSVDFSGWLTDTEHCELTCLRVVADPDTVCEGTAQTFSVDAWGSDGVSGVSWDLDNDGLFDDGAGEPITATLGAGANLVSAQVSNLTESCSVETLTTVQPEGAPQFAGLDSVVEFGLPGYAGLRLDWQEPFVACASPGRMHEVFNVYRSKLPGFTPSLGTLRAACLPNNYFIDIELVPGDTYYYIVRAESPDTIGTGPCGGGLEDSNLREHSGVAPAGTGAVVYDVPFFTITSRDAENTLQWINPADAYATTRFCWRVDQRPTGPDDPAATCFEQTGVAGAADLTTHSGLSNGVTYYYGVWVNNGTGSYSAGRFTSGRPFDASGFVSWAYSTGATLMSPPTAGGGLSLYTTANDRGLHSVLAGATGGEWPAAWTPFLMNGPVQGQAVVVPQPLAGANGLILLGSQDGNVYAVDDESGALLWSTETTNGMPLGESVQAPPTVMLIADGAADDLAFVGTRSSMAENAFYALDAGTGAVVWEFTNSTDPAEGDNGDGTGAIGIISAQAAIDSDFQRVYFTSRSRAGGSPSTVWCLSTIDGSLLWAAAVGDIDGSPTIRGTTVYAGTNTSTVVALAVGSGPNAGDLLWSLPCDDGPIKSQVIAEPLTSRLFWSTATKVWGADDLGGGAPSPLFSVPLPSPSRPVSLAPDHELVLVGSEDGRLYQLDLTADPANPQLLSIELGDGSGAIGGPTWDDRTNTVHVGSEGGVLYEVTVPLLPPQAVISAPADGATFGAWQQVNMDGSGSTVPDGFSIWFAALEQRDPMTVTHAGSTLQESFTAAAVDSYVIRLVIASPAAKPDETILQGSALPCSGETECDSTQVVISRSQTPGLHSFELAYVFPEVTFVRWDAPADPTVERSADGGQTWTAVPGSEPLGPNHLRDDSVVAGTTYHYRMKGSTDTDWTYLGSTSTAPGQPVAVPAWSAPRVIPDFSPAVSSITWALPFNQPYREPTIFDATGTLSLLLRPEPGRSLGGCTIRIFLNEETFQVLDGAGNDPYTSNQVAVGRDEPGCVTRKDLPDVTVIVPPGEGQVTVDIPGIVYGANSFRFEVTDASGGYSERALLYPIHDQLTDSDPYEHARFHALLFDNGLGADQPLIRGYGPVSRRSPDCRDHDMSPDPVLAVTQALYFGSFTQRDPACPYSDCGITSFAFQTDENGNWSTQIGPFPGKWKSVFAYVTAPECDPGKLGSTGRRITDDQGFVIVDAGRTICQSSSPSQGGTSQLALANNGNPVPVLDYVPSSVTGTSWASATEVIIRFRIADNHHDVDMSSVHVTNQSLTPSLRVRAYYANSQGSTSTTEDWGWMVASVPLAAGDNQLLFEAADLAGSTMSETRTVTGEIPPLEAKIIAPTSGDTYLDGDTILLDGSSSTAPDGAFIWFGAMVQGSGEPMTLAYAGSTLQDSFVASGAVDSYVVRLVVAAPDSIPSDAELRGTALPCWTGGSSVCSSVEVVINAEPAQAVIASPAPAFAYENGDTVTLDGAGSVVPSGWQAWFGAMVQWSGAPMTLAYSTSSLQGSFPASGSVDSYVIRLVLAEPGQMPDDSLLHGTALPCTLSPQCTASEVVISHMTPLAVISQPEPDLTYDEGELITIDGAGSQAPAGSDIWFGVMEDGSGDPMTLTYSTTSLQGSFTASSAVNAYLIRLVIAEPGTMPDAPALRSTTTPCAASPQCSAADLIITKKSARARIDAPLSGGTFTHGQQILIDGTSSVVPSGFQIWIGAMVEDDSGPMTTVYTGSDLQGSVTASETDQSYLIRLVVATPDGMPDDSALRGPGLPCRLTSNCDSTEVRIHQPYDFEIVYNFPEVTLMRWRGVADPRLESVRYPDSPNDSWELPDCGSGGGYYFMDEDYECSYNAEGADYYYRIKSAAHDPDWTYLGGGASPGQRVNRPSWSAPKIVPYFEPEAPSSVTWDVPDGAVPFFSQGTLSLLLKGQSDQSLASSTIRVYVNEETFQVEDGVGKDILFLNNGFDQPACMIEKASPDLVVEVGNRDDQVTIEVPGIVYGANSLRFEVSSPDGGYSERAIIAPIHEELSTYATYTYSDLIPLLFGDELGHPDYQLNGIGPVSRFSPDCGDSDQSVELDIRDQSPQYHARLKLTRPDSGDTTETLIHTGTDARWSAALGSYNPGETIELEIDIDTCSDFYPLKLGRTIRTPNWMGGTTTIKNLTKTICGRQSLAPQPLLVTATGVNPVPSLDYLPAAVYGYPLGSPSRPDEVDKRIDFRIVDSYHDVDLESVTVTNHSLDTPVTVRAYYAAEQLRAQGSWGWMVATLPMLAPADNLIEMTAADSNGGTMSEIQTVTFREPEVMAAIAAPADGSTWRSYTSIPLDGSTSQGENGLEGRWVFFSGADGEALPALEQSGLTAAVSMPHGYGGLRARLVVAEPGWLPGDLYTSELPCSIYAGDGKCDSIEITLGNSCCPSPDTPCYGDDAPGLSLSVVTPANGESVPFDERLWLSAQMSGGSGYYVYRWWLAPADNPEARVRLTPNGADDGFDPSYATWELDPAAAGLAVGRYFVTVEAGYIEGTEGCITGLRTSSVVLRICHVLSAVAPGQVTSGHVVRVYSRSLTLVPSAYLRIASDYQQPPEHVLELPCVNGAYVEFEVGSEPGQVPLIPLSGNAAWYLQLATDGNGAQGSYWVSALKVIESGSTITPLTVTNEEDSSCGLSGSECAHPILPGQTWRGSWGDVGDRDYFSVLMAEGATYRVKLDFIDGTQSTDIDIRQPDPEVLLAEPGGGYSMDSYADDRSSTDRNSTLVWTARNTGIHLIICSARQGVSDYTLSLELLSEASSPNFQLIPYESSSYVVTSDNPTTRLRMSLFDPFGNPASGSEVFWEITGGSGSLSEPLLTGWDGSATVEATMAESQLMTVKLSTDLPTVPVSKSTYATPNREPNPILGVVSRRAEAIVSDSTIAKPEEILEEYGPWDSEARGTSVSRQLEKTAAKVDSECDDPKLQVGMIDLPPEAGGVLGIDFIFTDAAGTERSSIDDLQLTDVSDMIYIKPMLRFADYIDPCQTFRDSLVNLPIGINILSSSPDPNQRGLVSRDGVNFCESINIEVSESEPFFYRAGTRAMFIKTDSSADDPYIYASLELLRASVVLPTVEVIGDCSISSVWRIAADAVIDVAPEPLLPVEVQLNGEPGVDFFHLDGNSTRWYYRSFAGYPLMVEQGISYRYLSGPIFHLYDAYGNRVAEYGYRDDHLLADPSLLSFVEEHEYNPHVWFVVAHPLSAGTRYEVLAIAMEEEIPRGTTYANNLRVGDISPFHVPISMHMQSDDIPLVLWSCPQSNYTVIPCEEGYSLQDLGVASPHGPVESVNGVEMVYRIQPVLSSDLLEDLPNQTCSVASRIYVSGPTARASQLLLKDEPPDEKGRPVEVDDVKLRVWTIEKQGDDLQQTVELEGRPPEINPVVSETAVFGAGSFTARGISVIEAPKEPGFYQVFAEPQDAAYENHTGWHTPLEFRFLVRGVELLEQNYSEAGYQVIEEEKNLRVNYITAGQDDLEGHLKIRFEYEGDEPVAERTTVVEPVFSSCSSGFFTCSKLARIVLAPKLTDSDAPSCSEAGTCYFFEVPPRPFKLQVGIGGATPQEGLEEVLDEVYGHGAVIEIPLGEHRQLTLAKQADQDGVEHDLVVEWRESWNDADPPAGWYSEVEDPNTVANTLFYSFYNNVVTFQDKESYCFRAISMSETEGGKIMAFHASSDVEHPHTPRGDGFPTNGYCPERTGIFITKSGDMAEAKLRGTLPEFIRSSICIDDRDCANWMLNDLTNERVELDDIILYYADRHGVPPDIIKAQIYHESIGSGLSTDKIRMNTHSFRYEPWTWDYKKYGGCDLNGSLCIVSGTRCDGTTGNSLRRISVEPYCHYAQGGFVADLQNDGLEPAVDGNAAFFGATLEMEIAQGTSGSVPVALTGMVAPTGYPVVRARFQLFDNGSFDDPYCINLNETDAVYSIQVCINGNYASSRGEFMVRLECPGGGCGGTSEWSQVAQRDHRILRTGLLDTSKPDGPQYDDVHSGELPGSQEFSLSYTGLYPGVTADSLILGEETPAPLTLKVKPVLVAEIPTGDKVSTLPTEIPDLETYLNSLYDGSSQMEYPSNALSINDWVRHNVGIFGGFNATLRVQKGSAAASQNYLHCDLGEDDLYDPKFSALRNQYILASSFGMMQVGILAYDPETTMGSILMEDYDLNEPDNHILLLSYYPDIGIRAGVGEDKYYLYWSSAFQTSCSFNCSVDDLRSRVRNMLYLYNRNIRYPEWVIDDNSKIEYFSTHPEFWRKP
jgi:outer membrane protein assembly factor BamB/flagellar hook assembly protein FlgD